MQTLSALTVLLLYCTAQAFSTFYYEADKFQNAPDTRLNLSLSRPERATKTWIMDLELCMSSIDEMKRGILQLWYPERNLFRDVGLCTNFERAESACRLYSKKCLVVQNRAFPWDEVPLETGDLFPPVASIVWHVEELYVATSLYAAK
jgi:hypothetical protein